MSYVLYPPDVIIFFSAEHVLTGGSVTLAVAGQIEAIDVEPSRTPELEGSELLDALRALGDANRLRILDLLGSGELYANEIVGRLGIAQSAVSRHLSQLERSGLVVVNPRGGMKYYAIDAARLAVVGDSLKCRAVEAASATGTRLA
jgi:ArsR family transcriptional regulator